MANTDLSGGIMTLEGVKASVQRMTGWRRPSDEQLATLVQSRRIATFRCRDDGFIPNNPIWPVAVYRGAVKLPRSLDPAAVWEALFESNGWGDTWRDGIYDYLHYHSRVHEVLGIARGNATVRLGGNKGRIVKLKAGDAVVIPAGTGHQCLSASKTFMAVGAYPPNGTYDECGPTVEEHDRNVKAVRRVGRPRKDPIFGSGGPLLKSWRPKRRT
jgi:uncharacterized protein YjlB